MKVVIVYAAQPGSWPGNRTLALQRLAGSNVLGHVLNRLDDVQPFDLLVITVRERQAIADWLSEFRPPQAAEVLSIAAGTTFIDALVRHRPEFEDRPLLLLQGSIIAEASYRGLAAGGNDLSLLISRDSTTAAVQDRPPSASWAGACYFRSGQYLANLLDQLPTGVNDSLDLLLASFSTGGARQGSQEAVFAIDTAQPSGLLRANARLLGMGYGTADAIGRSYVEDFTVIPPVFLHESAVVERAVVGPFANLEAGAQISNSVVQNSIVGLDAVVENIVLEGSIIGDRARVYGAEQHLIAEEDREG